MFALVFRELLVVVAGLMVIWFVWRCIRKIGRRDRREERIKELMDNVDELVELSKKVKVNPKQVKAARKKLSELEREGN